MSNLRTKVHPHGNFHEGVLLTATSEFKLKGKTKIVCPGCGKLYSPLFNEQNRCASCIINNIYSAAQGSILESGRLSSGKGYHGTNMHGPDHCCYNCSHAVKYIDIDTCKVIYKCSKHSKLVVSMYSCPDWEQCKF